MITSNEGGDKKHTSAIDVVLFDLGGVLVELTGMDVLTTWTGLDKSEMWKRWLTSDAVRDFEAGRNPPAQFAENVVAEFKLPVSPKEFLTNFRAWPSGLYQGVEALLLRCKQDFRLGCLSNTNEIHWPVMRDDFGLGAYLQDTFISCELGLLKPDVEMYDYVIEHLDVTPERIVYFDDNLPNVEGARDCGLQAHLCRGGIHLSQLLAEIAGC